MRGFRSSFLARLVWVFATVFVAGSAGAQTWSTYQGNNQHNGYVPIEVDPSAFTQNWQSQFAASNLSQAACGNGMVFVSGQVSGSYSNYNLYGIEAATGLVDWTATWENLDSFSPPALSNGLVYAQSLDNSEGGLVSCFYANGDFGWRQPFQSQWGTFLAPTIDSGVAYVEGGEYGGMYAFGALDGTHDWFCNQLMQYTGWAPSLDATYAYTYTGPNDEIGTYQAGFYAVNRVTGNADYQIYDANNQFSQIGQTPAISGTMAYVVNGGRIVAFDLKHRLLSWQISRACTGQPDAVGNVVYAIDNGNLAAFDATTGAFQWNWTPPSGSATSPFIVTNNLAFVGNGTSTYAVDLTTHQQVWSTGIAGTLSIGNGSLYVSGSSGLLTSFSLGALQVAEPISYQLVRGTALSGNLASILSVDNQALRIQEGATLTTLQAPVQIVITGTSTNLSPAQLKFHLQASANTPGIGQSIELWNYSTSQWVSMNTVPATVAESADEVAAPNPAQYVQPGTGQVQARVSWKQTGPTLVVPWRVAIDEAVWLEG